MPSLLAFSWANLAQYERRRQQTIVAYHKKIQKQAQHKTELAQQWDKFPNQAWHQDKIQNPAPSCMLQSKIYLFLVFRRFRFPHIFRWWRHDCLFDCCSNRYSHINKLWEVFWERQLRQLNLQLRVPRFHWWIVRKNVYQNEFCIFQAFTSLGNLQA